MLAHDGLTVPAGADFQDATDVVGSAGSHAAIVAVPRFGFPFGAGFFPAFARGDLPPVLPRRQELPSRITPHVGHAAGLRAASVMEIPKADECTGVFHGQRQVQRIGG